jgi:hypothetical protein
MAKGEMKMDVDVTLSGGYPGPFKCPDCDVWWAGFTHQCKVEIQAPDKTNSYTDECICPEYAQDIACPVHKYRISWNSPFFVR